MQKEELINIFKLKLLLNKKANLFDGFVLLTPVNTEKFLKKNVFIKNFTFFDKEKNLLHYLYFNVVRVRQLLFSFTRSLSKFTTGKHRLKDYRVKPAKLMDFQFVLEEPFRISGLLEKSKLSVNVNINIIAFTNFLATIMFLDHKYKLISRKTRSIEFILNKSFLQRMWFIFFFSNYVIPKMFNLIAMLKNSLLLTLLNQLNQFYIICNYFFKLPFFLANIKTLINSTNINSKSYNGFFKSMFSGLFRITFAMAPQTPTGLILLPVPYSTFIALRKKSPNEPFLNVVRHVYDFDCYYPFARKPRFVRNIFYNPLTGANKGKGAILQKQVYKDASFHWVPKKLFSKKNYGLFDLNQLIFVRKSAINKSFYLNIFLKEHYNYFSKGLLKANYEHFFKITNNGHNFYK